jgi:hypothetical protein
MQHDRDSADFEARVEGGITDFANSGRFDQRHYNPAPVTIELCGLDDYDEWNGVFVRPTVAMDVELGHQSEEYSSAIDPDFALKSFHAFTVASTDLDFARRSWSAAATYANSRDSTTLDKLSVRFLALLTKSSFKVRLTGRFRADAW